MWFRGSPTTATGERMALKVCNVPGCPNLQREARCPEHRREAERKRGTRQTRGYDARHQAERKRWALVVAAGRATCARCGMQIEPCDAWDLDHADDRTKYLGPSHASCNRRAPRLTQ